MKLFKIAIILSAILIFIIACNQPNTSNTNVTNNTTTTSSINSTNTAIAPQPSSSSSSGAAADELASARKIYSEQCVKCHKEDGTGGVSMIDGKRIKAPNFTGDRMKNDKDEDWIDTINNGAKEDGMPAFKDKLSAEEIKSLVSLIHRDFQGKP